MKLYSFRATQFFPLYLQNFFLYNLILLILACLITGLAFSQTKSNNKAALSEKMINVDFTRRKGTLNTFFKECVGAGRASEGLRADWQQQLAYVRKECGFNAVRIPCSWNQSEWPVSILLGRRITYQSWLGDQQVLDALVQGAQ